MNQPPRVSVRLSLGKPWASAQRLILKHKIERHSLERDLTFNSLHNLQWLAVWAVAVVLACVLIVVLLRYERRLVRARVGNTLLLLRLAVLAALLFTLLEPVSTWMVDKERTGRILLAVDLSQSMFTVDKHATNAEKLRWARGIGMIGNDRINARLDRWVAAYEAEEEPPWVDADETADPEERQRLAAIRKDNLEGIFEEIDKLSRQQIVHRLLSKSTKPLLPQLAEVADVEIRLFGGRTEVADESILEESFAKPPGSIHAGISDLSQPLAGVNFDSETSPVVGVILISDGRDNSRSNPVSAASRLKDLDVPVYVIQVGSEFRPKDLAIASLDYPQSTYKDDKPMLIAKLFTTGFEGEQLTVELVEKDGAGDETVIDSKQVTPDTISAQVEFELKADEVGRHEYKVRTAVQPGEISEDNNQQSFAMSVVDDTARVLVLEGEARWEFHFLNNALDRDARVDVKSFVFRQPFIGRLPQTFFPMELNVPNDPDDLENSPFSEFDLVIVGDVASHHIPQQGWELLEKFVTETGGTLVMSAGKRYFPRAHRSEVIERLVPLTDLREVVLSDDAAKAPPSLRGFHLKLTPEGERESMLRFDADELKNRRIWDDLPGHLWGLVGQARPGASVLAYAVQRNKPATLEAERNSALIVHQHYGAGQVLWLGIDSTWRWRHRVGDRYHHRFWGQMARWAAENKSVAGTADVRFGPDRTDIEVGEDAIIRARWMRNFLKRFPELKAKTEIYRLDADNSDEPFSVIDLRPSANRPLIHSGRAVSLPTGTYRLKLVVERADLGKEEVVTQLFVHEQQTLELSDVSANGDLLVQISESSGGRRFLPDQIQEIPGLFDREFESSSTRHEISLWDRWWTLILFFTLMTTEWVVRKLNGLP